MVWTNPDKGAGHYTPQGKRITGPSAPVIKEGTSQFYWGQQKPQADAQTMAVANAMRAAQQGTGPNPGAWTGGNQGGGGRAGGGGAAGPNLDQIRQIANEAFAWNQAPWDAWRQSIESQYQFNAQPYETMTGQANAYNPDFAAMEQAAVGRVQAAEAQRSQAAMQRLQAVRDLTNQVGLGFSGNMQTALRDLTGQGINVSPYVEQTGQMGANLAQGGANMLGLGGNLDQIAAQNQADSIRGLAQTRLGGEAALANNRSALLNQIAASRAQAEGANTQARVQALGQLGVQQSQAQMQNDQARREFLLKYGI